MIAKRIKEIIDEKGLTASKFADLIGVQRSGISHILSGRNKPSLDLVQKTLTAFDEIRAEWLLTGKGPKHYSLEDPSEPAATLSDTQEEKNITIVTLDEGSRATVGDVKKDSEQVKKKEENTSSDKTESDSSPSLSVLKDDKTSAESERKVKRIIVLFDDGLFESYEPHDF